MKRLSLKNKLKTKSRFQFMLVGYLILLVCATVFFAISASTYGATLRSVEKEIAALEKENRQLSEEVVAASSLIKTAPESEELGLVTPHEVIYLTNEEKFAWGQDSN